MLESDEFSSEESNSKKKKLNSIPKVSGQDPEQYIYRSDENFKIYYDQ